MTKWPQLLVTCSQDADIDSTRELAQLLTGKGDRTSTMELIWWWVVRWAARVGLRTWRPETGSTMVLLGVRPLQAQFHYSQLALRPVYSVGMNA